MVYKVCDFLGPRIKISEEPEKTTIPGSKIILRAFNEEDKPVFDVLCLSNEEIPLNNMKVFNRFTGEQHNAFKV